MKGGVVLLCLALWSQQALTQEFSNDSELLPSITLNNTFYGCGLSLFDVNKDGLDDLTIGGKSAPLRLFLNQGGSFEMQNLGLFFNEEVKAVLWADYDNDGDADLFISRMFASVRLYRNDGGLQLTDVTSTSGILVESATNWGAAWGDVNNDGYLDLYVCKYNNPNSFPNTYQHWNRLYLNNTDGTFTEISVSAGVSDGVKFSFLASFIDFDGDGWQDIYVINDKTSPNSLYRNNGDLTFTEVGGLNGAGIVIDAMSCAPGDFDNDGDDDIYITNTDDGNALLLADETGFSDVAQEMGIAVFHDSWGANFFDADNDGDLDLFVATQAGPEQLPNQFFRNNNGVFMPMVEVFGGTDIATTYATGICDLNNDGAMDIVNHNATPDFFGLWMNNGNDGHYLKLGLNGVLTNRDGIGTRIEIWHCGHYQTRYSHCGESYLTQNSSYEHFGLGECNVVDSLRLNWLSGVTETYYSLSVDTLIQFLEGQSFQLETHNQDSIFLCPGDSIELCASGFPVISWNGSMQSCITAFAGNSYAVNGAAYEHWFAADTIHLVPYELESPEFELLMPFCAGAPNGNLGLVNDSADYSSILWNNGDTTFVLQSLNAGWYSYTMSDLNGCIYVDSLELTEPAELELELDLIQPGAGQSSEVSFSATGGTPPYDLTWWEDALWDASDVPSGLYTAILTDAMGCTDTISFEVLEYTNVNETLLLEQLSITNPVEGTIEIPSGIEWQLMDLEGRIIQSSYRGAKTILNFSELSSGLYLLMLQNGRQTEVHRLLNK